MQAWAANEICTEVPESPCNRCVTGLDFLEESPAKSLHELVIVKTKSIMEIPKMSNKVELSTL